MQCANSYRSTWNRLETAANRPSKPLASTPREGERDGAALPTPNPLCLP